MSQSIKVAGARVSLDSLAVHAFVQEILEVVDNVAAAYIYAPPNKQIWVQEFQTSSLESDLLSSIEQAGASTQPAKVDLGQGYTAFAFPLPCDNLPNCVFVLVVYSVDPPSLRSVGFGVESMLSCIARQVDVDCTLSTTKLVQPESPANTLPDILKLIKPGKPLELSLIRATRALHAGLGIESIVIAIPGKKITVAESNESLSDSALQRILTQVFKQLTEKQSVITARLKTEDGKERVLIGAPILQGNKAIQGLVLATTMDPNSVPSNAVRALANRLTSLLGIEEKTPNLLNRYELVTKVDDIVRRQPQRTHSFVYFDLDRIHTINDAFGFSGGDRALAIFQRILCGSAGANDCVAHLGGDRFALFMPGASADTGVSKASQILRLLSQESIVDGAKSINLSASAGVVDTEAASKGAEDMLILSEVASRGAQDRGGNQCALFQDIDSSIIQRRSDVDKVGFIQMALIEDQFCLHAQRITSLHDPSDQKFELLARLQTDGAADRSPVDFLSAAERYQLMAALDRWVINSALKTIASGDNLLEISLTTFAINVSAQSLQDDKFIEFIESRIAETGVAPDTLCFELTETSLVRQLDRAQRFLHRLQRLGCRVALDDFGTGYSSFAYLKTLPVNYLKIDGAFVRDLLENDLSKAIVKAVVSIAEVIGAQTVAEHVENEMVNAWLKEAGVDYVQGFMLHKPEPLDAVLSNLGSAYDILQSTDRIDLTLLDDLDQPLDQRG